MKKVPTIIFFSYKPAVMARGQYSIQEKNNNNLYASQGQTNKQ